MEKKLNLFEHYKHKECIPLENNLTRIFARILHDNLYISEGLFRIINQQITKKYMASFYNGGTCVDDLTFDISIQKNIEKIKDELLEKVKNDPFSRIKIIGVALTAEHIEFNKEDFEEANDNQIPDICISLYNGTFIIIEAKKTSENAEDQLGKYVEAIASVCRNEENNDNIDKYTTSITWDQIINLMEKSVSCGKNDLIINEYLEYLDNHFPSLFAYRSLKEILNSECRLIKNPKLMIERMKIAIENINKINENVEFTASKDEQALFINTFPNNQFYQQRIYIGYEKDIFFTTWLSNTKGQMMNFIEKQPKFGEINDVEVLINIANFQSAWEYIDISKEINENIFELFKEAYKVCGRAKGRDIITKCDEIAKIFNCKSIYYNDEIKDCVNRETERNISLGIRIVKKMPLDLLKESYEKENYGNSEQDIFAKNLYKFAKENMIFLPTK